MELLCGTKSRWRMPLGVEGKVESGLCGDDGDDAEYSRKRGFHVVVLRRAAGGRYFSETILARHDEDAV